MSVSEGWFEDFEEDVFSSDQEGSPSSEDGSMVGEGAGPSWATSAHKQTRNYTIIDRPALQRLQGEALAQVQSILGCNTTVARTLLTHFTWDAEAVLGTIAERGQDEVYRRAALLPRAAAPPTTPAGTCGVCLCEVGPEASTAMDCGHSFCRGCWRQHLRLGVQEGLSRRLRCMGQSCGVICNEDKVRELLQGDPELLRKYEASLVEGYVDDNKRAKWCPSTPNCGRAARANKEPYCEVECPCGQKYCFNCGETPHSPATCEMLADWQRRIRNGSETASWLSANTKGCPKCSKPVEKNGGCNLVVCRCGQAFCWLCGQATGRAHTWTNIEGHSCGAYKDEAEERASDAERTLKRYLHYLTRYEAHLASLALESKSREAAEAKANALQGGAAGGSWGAWVHEALSQLLLARSILSYSYIFAYYLFGGVWFKDDFAPAARELNQALFEDKQGQLEMEVERLAKLIELPPEELLAQRMAVINLAAGIDTRIVRMYEVIENDIAAQLAYSSINVAPYKGRRTQAQPPTAAALQPLPALALAPDAPQPSTAHHSDVVDLSMISSDDEAPGGLSALQAVQAGGGNGGSKSGGKRLRGS